MGGRGEGKVGGREGSIERGASSTADVVALAVDHSILSQSMVSRSDIDH